MSIVYNGAHSIYFKKHSIDPILSYDPNIGKYYYSDLPGDVYTYANSWTYFHMVPATRHFVVPPEPRLQFVNIPRSNRILDVTNFLAGNVTYEASEGDWEFIIDHDKYSDWSYAYDAISDFFDGSWFDVWLGDQLNYRYTGRIYANTYRPGEDYSRINLHYIFDVNLYDEINPYDGPDAPAPGPGPDPDPDPDPQPVDYFVTDVSLGLIKMDNSITATLDDSTIHLYISDAISLNYDSSIYNYKLTLTIMNDSSPLSRIYFVKRIYGTSNYTAISAYGKRQDGSHKPYAYLLLSSFFAEEPRDIYLGYTTNITQNHALYGKIEHLHSGSEIIL